MMKRILSLGLAAVLLLSAGCTKKGGTSAAASGAANTVTYPAAISEEDYEAQWKVREDNPVKDETIASLNAFAQSSAEKLLTNAGQNENYSPLSLYYALTLLANGASGETKANLESVLHTEDAAAMAKELGNLLRMLYRDNKAAKLKIANSLWMQNDVQFQDAFKATATDDLYASLFNVDFTDETTVDKMIAWIRENTSNLEPSFSLDPETIMAIINTIDYRAAWYDEFMKEKNEKLPFHTLAGDIDAEYMTQKKEFTTYYRGDGFARATLRLAEGGEMIFVLPDENTTLSELLSRENALNTLLEGGESRDADLSDPEVPLQQRFRPCAADQGAGRGGHLHGEGGLFRNDSAAGRGLPDQAAVLYRGQRKGRCGVRIHNDRRGGDGSAAGGARAARLYAEPPIPLCDHGGRRRADVCRHGVCAFHGLNGNRPQEKRSVPAGGQTVLCRGETTGWPKTAHSPRSSPKKNSATVPMPVCEPMTVPTLLIMTGPSRFGNVASTRSATLRASS